MTPAEEKQMEELLLQIVEVGQNMATVKAEAKQLKEENEWLRSLVKDKVGEQ